MVARSRGIVDASEVGLLGSAAEVAPYDLDALTTAGRYRVYGRAATAAGEQDFNFFVKVVQSWERSPLFSRVPPEHRERALAGLSWRTEPLIYRSDLADRLPPGLCMPRALGVFDIDEKSAALWLDYVEHIAGQWDTALFERAGYLLGRLAASDRVRPLAELGRATHEASVRTYAEGRVRNQVLPALRSSELWSHPLVSRAFDERLRDELLAAAARVETFVDELETMPTGTFHGDACTRNFLVQACSPDLVLIDFGFWGQGPVGFDLGQLLLGEVQLGERPASCLPELEAGCLPAYVRGLRDEGCQVGEGVVRRAHALQLLLFSGLSAIPLEHLDQPLTEDLHGIAGERAASARFILDLVDATA